MTGEGVSASRHAGAMLLHAFFARAGAGAVPASGAGRPGGTRRCCRRSAMCFALGAATIEQFKHLAAADAGPLAGLGALPGLRTLRPRLAAIADGTGPGRGAAPVRVRDAGRRPGHLRACIMSMTTSSPTRAPSRSAKGWNNKRGRAEKGRADTHVTAHDGRAVCFVTGEPSGLTVTLPKALAELKKAAGPGAQIMLGFDRGGAYAQVFRHCREQDVHWVTYRRAPLAVPAMLPVITTITIAGRRREITWAEETVTSRTTARPGSSPCPSAARWSCRSSLRLRCLPGGHPGLAEIPVAGGELPQVRQRELRHRQDLRLHRQHRGEHQDHGQPAPQGRPTPQSARRKRRWPPPNATWPRLLADPAITPAAKNTRLIPAAQKKITAARKKLQAAAAARDRIPAKLPANAHRPRSRSRLLRAGRRGLQMVLRLLAHNAEHWLASRLNAYLRDEDEYRAITRETIIRGLAGTITFTPAAITVILETPAAPHRPRPGPAHRRDQPHPARHARRQPPDHLPSHRRPGFNSQAADPMPEIWAW